VNNPLHILCNQRLG